MTQLEQQIRKTQQRLWLNRWAGTSSTCLTIGVGLFAVVVLVQRLYDVAMPLGWVAAGMACASLLGSIIWAVIIRDSAAVAAAALDDAAGLRERISSAQFCDVATDDPFARAVVADAERISASISPRQHIPIRMPRSAGIAAVSMVLAALVFLVPVGLLNSAEAVAAADQDTQVRQTKVAVKRKMDKVRELIEANPALDDLKENLDDPLEASGGMLRRPNAIRHEAVKKIDNLADAVKQKRNSAKYDSVRETRKIMRGLKVPKSSTSLPHKIAKALSRGDFKSAKEEVKALQEQLATLKSENDKDLTNKLSKQLDDLAKQLEKASTAQDFKKKLEKAGLSKEDAKRLLENLKKKDLDQIKKQLEENGLTPKMAQKLAKQMKAKQKAGSVAKKMSQAAKQAAKCNSPGQMGEAISGLSMAADQLSELEQLESEMGELDSTLADLQNTKDELDKPCSSCQGTGCSKCQGKGNKGMGRQMKSGRGGLASEDKTNVNFKTERAKVHTGKGAIIGQFLFDGEQVKGEVSSGLSEIVTAAERDASDRISRNRIPRQYQKAVREYFSNVQRSLRSAKLAEPGSKTEGSDEKSKTTGSAGTASKDSEPQP